MSQDRVGQDPAADQQPTTGLPEVDEALAGLAELEERPVAEHPEALAAVHEVLHQTLHAPAGPAASAAPTAAPAGPSQASAPRIHRPVPRPPGR